MLDTVDNYLKEYYNGILELKIKQREQELRIKNCVLDENIGGGRALNKYNNPIEQQYIKIEQDTELSKLKHNYRMINEFVNSNACEQLAKSILELKYKKKYTWESLAIRLHINEKTARRKINTVKKQLKVIVIE